MLSEQTSRTWAGALGKSGTAAVLEHKFYPDSQAFTKVDVTDEGRPAFSQSICPCPTDGFRTNPPNTGGCFQNKPVGHGRVLWGKVGRPQSWNTNFIQTPKPLPM